MEDNKNTENQAEQQTPEVTEQESRPSEPENSGRPFPQVSNPFAAIQAMVLKPNAVFATLKDVNNWSWIAFFFVSLFTILPTWLYFGQVDMVWYSEMAVELQMPDVSPSEKENAMQLMQQQSLGEFTALFVVLGAIIMNAVFAFYLHKITQIDEDNVLSFGDWYGFTWWATLPFAFIGIFNTLIVLVMADPQLSPEYLSVFSLAFVAGIAMDSSWFGWAQGISLDSLWVIYLTAVGVSQWTQLNSRQCLIIATAPFAIIWGVWALFIIF